MPRVHAGLDAVRVALFDQFARIGRAVASAPRLELLDLLAQGEKTVETLARQARLPVKNTSAHLRALREGALVVTRREGTHIVYRLADPAVAECLAALQELARRRLAEVQRLVDTWFAAPGALEPMGAAELRRRLRNGTVTLLDVRPADEFGAGHIPGARSVPLADLERRLAEIPRNREVVAYCRGPYCVLAVRAVERLARHGFAARRFAGGVREWRRAGHSVLVTPSTRRRRPAGARRRSA
jgi:rhodanese-related sulfurtransferase